MSADSTRADGTHQGGTVLVHGLVTAVPEPSRAPSRSGVVHNHFVATVQRAHPLPNVSTVKVMYAHAFECARPDCHEWLYRQETGKADPVLNSRVAHIHARRPGGPRWLEGMEAEENRSVSNLLLLCIPHSYEIDEQADRFPADLLQDWRADQRRVYERRRHGWPIDGESARQVILLSFETPAFRAQVLSDVVRASELLAVRAEASRVQVAAEAAAWRATWERARTRPGGWDPRTGESIHTEPLPAETERHEAELMRALTIAAASLQSSIEAVKAEVAVARAATPAASAWCDWVQRSADVVVRAASSWPGPPPVADDERVSNAAMELRAAASALAAKLRGDSVAETPPDPPAPHAPASVDSAAGEAVREHKALLDRARPHSRVSHLPYDASLCSALGDAAEAAATIPPVLSFTTVCLSATAYLAAAVARNASDDEMVSIVATCIQRRPLVAAVRLVSELSRRLEERGAAELVQATREVLRQEIVGQDWSRPEAWAGGEVGGQAIFWELSRLSSYDDAKALLGTALAIEPARLDELVLCCASWIEHTDPAPGVGRFERRYRELQPWFPSDAVRRAAKIRYPHVKPAVTRDEDAYSDATESLLSHILRLLTAPSSS